MQDMDILDEKLLENLDDTTVKSLNGCRVTARILQLVPKIEVKILTFGLISLIDRIKCQ